MRDKASKIRSKAPSSRLDLASAVSERVQIQDVHLLETRAKRGVIREKLPGHLRFSVHVTTQLEKSNSMLVVRPFLGLVAKNDEAADDEEALRIEALFSLAYKLDITEGLSEANFDAFGQTNGLYNAWPFWREYVQATTTRLGLPPLTIPVLPPATRDAKAVGRTSASTPKSGRMRKKNRLS